VTGALPPLEPGAIPPAVRAAGEQSVDRYRTALGFERVLLGEMLTTALPEPEAEGPQAATVPDTLADALVARGGTGIAAQLYAALASDPALPADAALPEDAALPADAALRADAARAADAMLRADASPATGAAA
jgi:hypothetical protein